MSVIRTSAEAVVEGAAATLYADDRESLGSVTPHTRVTALNPEAVALRREAERGFCVHDAGGCR
ncbi:hypothetical protein [Microbacterium sp. ABRD28]|uniref:hypothetical protein n=1 Tax=Microbacterium sp. ABRD28 TaxID=2268461 RepID=UPI001F0B8A8A|nr:hypothetical protein [Microbacterium sp. ABRD28]